MDHGVRVQSTLPLGTHTYVYPDLHVTRVNRRDRFPDTQEVLVAIESSAVRLSGGTVAGPAPTQARAGQAQGLMPPGAPRRNEPAFVAITAAWVAERRGEATEPFGEALVAAYDRAFPRTGRPAVQARGARPRPAG